MAQRLMILLVQVKKSQNNSEIILKTKFIKTNKSYQSQFYQLQMKILSITNQNLFSINEVG